MLYSDFMELQGKEQKMDYETLAYIEIERKELGKFEKQLVKQMKKNPFYKNSDFKIAILKKKDEIYKTLVEVGTSDYFEI